MQPVDGNLLRQEHIEEEIRARLQKAELELRRCRADAQDAESDFVSLPRNADTHTVLRHTKRERLALRSYLQCLNEWTRFILDGKIPDRLKNYLVSAAAIAFSASGAITS